MLHSFSRTELLIGREGLDKLRESSVAVFGVGGVGSFAAEALARSGVGRLVLVDHDDICITNINRQVHATTSTVGRPKVDVMRERILDINPNARVVAIKRLYNGDSAGELLAQDYDYVIDAIDMVSSKIDLIVRCNSMNIRVISSMGAGNKLDPGLFRVADLYETSVCPLAKVIRKELRKRDIEALKVVYSTECPVKHKTQTAECREEKFYCSRQQEGVQRRHIPGSMSFVPSAAGLIISAEVIKDLLGYSGKE